MTDAFGRSLDYLRISVTDRCNYRCLYCMDSCGVSKLNHSDVLSFEEITEIAASAAGLGVRKLRLTGGEPLLRRDLSVLCRMLRAVPGIRELTVTTNGSLLRSQAEALKSAGVDRLNVSLDTLDPMKFRTITRLGSLEDVLEGLRAAERAGFQNTKIDTVLLGGWNTDEIPALAALTMKQSLSVRFIELMPMTGTTALPPERFVSAEAVLNALPELLPEETDGVAELYRLPGAVGTVGLIRPVSRSFCAACNRLRLTASGRLRPCLHSEFEIPLRGLHGKALTDAILQAAAAKPRCSCLTLDSGTAKTPMNEIGG